MSGSGTVFAAAVPGAQPGGLSSSMTLQVGGQTFSEWTDARLTRDLREIAGGFQLDLIDRARAAQAIPDSADPGPFFQMLQPGQACSILLDGELALVGYIDDIDLGWGADLLSARITGRDKTGDLVDCAAVPNGPAEFRNVDLLAVANIVCAPFGIAVRAETDIGAPFERLAANPHEKALPFLEKAARQRAVLLASDGVGGLLLTRGGVSAGPAALFVGGNVQAVSTHTSWRGRFSDVFVKGQTEAANGGRAGQAPALGPAAAPQTTGPTASALASRKAVEAGGILMTGHATDPEITRWRPDVRLTRTQSGMSTTQEQAEWHIRVARGEAEQFRYTVLGWRGQSANNGPGNALWRPNQRVAVYDPYTDIDTTMLVAGCEYQCGRQGGMTHLRVVGLTAYDRINESERRRHPRPHHRDTAGGAEPVLGLPAGQTRGQAGS